MADIGKQIKEITVVPLRHAVPPGQEPTQPSAPQKAPEREKEREKEDA